MFHGEGVVASVGIFRPPFCTGASRCRRLINRGHAAAAPLSRLAAILSAGRWLRSVTCPRCLPNATMSSPVLVKAVKKKREKKGVSGSHTHLTRARSRTGWRAPTHS